jgi:hypothetical protein
LLLVCLREEFVTPNAEVCKDGFAADPELSCESRFWNAGGGLIAQLRSSSLIEGWSAASENPASFCQSDTLAFTFTSPSFASRFRYRWATNGSTIKPLTQTADSNLIDST